MTSMGLAGLDAGQLTELLDKAQAEIAAREKVPTVSHTRRSGFVERVPRQAETGL